MITALRILTSAVKSGIRYLTVSNRGNTGALTPQESAPYGVDSVPVKGTKAYYASTETITSPDIITGYENKNQKALPGEFRGYATDGDGNFKFNFWMRTDGSILIGNSDDPSVFTNHFAQFEGLQTAYNRLKADHDALVDAFNAHVHPTAAVGPPSPPTPVPGSIPAIHSTGDIAPSKLTNVKTN